TRVDEGQIVQAGQQGKKVVRNMTVSPAPLPRQLGDLFYDLVLIRAGMKFSQQAGEFGFKLHGQGVVSPFEYLFRIGLIRKWQRGLLTKGCAYLPQNILP